MKSKAICLVFLVCFAAIQFPSRGACPRSRLDLYASMNDGDVWYFNKGPLATAVSSVSQGWKCGRSVFIVANSKGLGDELSWGVYSGSDVLLYGGRDAATGIELCYDPPLVALDENLVTRGGRRTSTTFGSFYYDGYWINFTQESTVEVRAIGAVTVPAGTFQDCQSVKSTLKTKGWIPGYDSVENTLSAESVLAPGVGAIKVTAFSPDMVRLGFQELTGGHVGGTDVRWFAGAQAPAVTSQPQGATTPVHGTVVFSIGASGTQPMNYRWMKNGVELNNGGRIAGATSPTLAISDVQLGDAGTYMIRLSNPLNCTTSAGAALGVLPDILPPAAIITVPVNNALTGVEDNVFRGTATDNARVVRVEYQLNSNPWATAVGTTGWRVTEKLMPGTNRFRARAVDASGLVSPTVVVRVVRIVESPIKLLIGGLGTISGASDEDGLHINRNYTLTATPAPGSLFSHWSTSVVSGPLNVASANPEYTFTMQTGLCVRADFVLNPFVAVRGNYDGLFYEADEARVESSGAFRLAVTKRGVYSGEIRQGTNRIPVSGRFSLDGRATNQFACGCFNATTEWRLDLEGSNTNYLTGRVRGNGGAWEASVLGDKVPVGGTFISPYQGKYTVVIRGARDLSVSDRPVGDSYGTGLVDSMGLLSFSGTLADKKAVLQSAQVSASGVWPMYVPLYGGRGMLIAWVQLSTNPPTASPVHSDLVLWKRPPISTAAYYPDGFEMSTTLVGSKYKPAKPVLPVSDGFLVFAGGNLAGELVYPITLTPSNTVVGPSSLSVSIIRSNGLFSGTFAPAGGSGPIAFGGVFVQGQTNGSGFFRNWGQSGLVWLRQ